MNRVIDILMKRDDVTEDEAKDMVSEAREALNNGEWDAMQVYLQLEDDYIFDVLS